MIYSSKPIPLYLFSLNFEKTRFSGLSNGNDERTPERRGCRITLKAVGSLKGGASIAQSHKHNKHFQEPIILQEIFERSELVAVEILKLPVALCTSSRKFRNWFFLGWEVLKIGKLKSGWIIISNLETKRFKIADGKISAEKQKFEVKPEV